MREWPLAIGALALLCVSWGVALASPTSVARGQRLAKANCASCHAIAGSAPSPMPDAPRFPDLTAGSGGRSLDEVFSRALVAGHPPMPIFAGDPQAMMDLLDFARSVQARPSPPSARDARRDRETSPAPAF